ncbi:CaiF/GrlA family transcriptional regulator, partial [Shigella flexneri]|nr:CaiF/GrlA family transcriptional regulator [Shigella flexneri]
MKLHTIDISTILIWPCLIASKRVIA